MKSGDISLVLFLLVCMVWLATICQGHRLFYQFRTKYPEVASKEIPYAFSHFAHPEKALYFFRRKAREFLRNDSELLRQRQLFFWLTLFSLITPFVGFAGLIFYATFHK
jgi:4-amino-4-deoxy-L-arabinose transferase-like glycosyltransferase